MTEEVKKKREGFQGVHINNVFSMAVIKITQYQQEGGLMLQGNSLRFSTVLKMQIKTQSYLTLLKFIKN